MTHDNTSISKEQENNVENDIKLSLKRSQELEQQIVENHLPNGFFIDEEENLMYQPKPGKDGKLPPSIFICSRLDISACTRDDNNHNHGCLLEFKDIDGHQHIWAMPMELLAGDGTRYREELLSMGLRIAPGSQARNLLTTYIQLSRPIARAKCVHQTGWYKDAYVFPDQTIGQYRGEKLILQTASAQCQSAAFFMKKD